MRIDPTSVNAQTQLPTPLDGGSKLTGTKSAVRDSDGVKTTSSFSPTADLSKLLALVSQQPDVRAGVVQDVTARVNSGELNTRAAATDTAAALLTTPGE